MKKILLVTAFLTIASCASSNQQIKLGFRLNDDSLKNIKNDNSFELSVFDTRESKKYLGDKKFANQKVEVETDKNLAEFFENKLTKGLILKGFRQGKDKIVTIDLKTLKFKSEIGFPVGISSVNIVVKVGVKDTKNNRVFAKNYVFDVNNKHFIMSCKSTDEVTVNNAVESLIMDILQDNELLESLSN
jgi:uncharacterized lipoprotein YajG